MWSRRGFAVRTRGNISRFHDPKAKTERWYSFGDVKHPSVTTVLSRFYTPGFAHAVNVAKEAVGLGGLIADGEMKRRFTYTWADDRWLEAYADYNPLDLLQDMDYVRGAAYRKSGEAADRGAICDRFVKEWKDLQIGIRDLRDWLEGVLEEGRLINEDDPAGTPAAWRCENPEVMPHLVSAYKFLTENEVDIKAVDLRFLSKGLKCGGEADALGMVNGEPYLIEFKTSAQPSRSHAIQVSVYKKGLRLKDVGCLIVCFTKEGYRAVRVTDEKACLSEWRRLRKCWGFAKDGTPWETIVRGNVDVFDQEAV